MDVPVIASYDLLGLSSQAHSKSLPGKGKNESYMVYMFISTYHYLTLYELRIGWTSENGGVVGFCSSATGGRRVRPLFPDTTRDTYKSGCAI